MMWPKVVLPVLYMAIYQTATSMILGYNVSSEYDIRTRKMKSLQINETLTGVVTEVPGVKKRLQCVFR